MVQINSKKMIEYVKEIFNNTKDLKSYLFENVSILNEIEKPTVPVIYALSLLQNEEDFIYIAPEVVSSFVVTISKCVFLKKNNIENTLWVNYL